MTEVLFEQLSALADGELDQVEAELLLARIQRDPELAKAWERYHLTGDAVRRSLAPVHDTDLASRVMAGIDAEGAVAQSKTDKRLGGAFELLKPVIGLGVAASVAMVAVMSIQNGGDDTLPSEVVPSAVITQTSTIDYSRVQPVNWNVTQQAEVKQQLNAYLINHNLHAGSRRLQGVNPYVHIAAYDTDPVDDSQQDNAESPDVDQGIRQDQ
ncbi:MAG: sigma-E factor negative regulatory protein [Gammaproteobacteria bacterium]|nr:sigma-E factor negative regulatory protein [Gammaproteobacteria bacterium]